MRILTQLSKPVFMLTTGFAIGLGAANYFAVTGNEHKATATVATSQHIQEAINTPQLNNTQLNLNAPVQLTTQAKPPQQGNASLNLLSEDIGLLEVADTSRQEITTTISSPEELAKTHLSTVETDSLEYKLRQEAETLAAVQLDASDSNRLLEHERL